MRRQSRRGIPALCAHFVKADHPAPPSSPSSPAAPRATISGGQGQRRPPPAKRAARFRRFVPWLVVGGLFAFIVMGLRPKPIEVEFGAVTHGPLQVSVYEEGKTRIRHRYSISPPVTGYLERVELRAGDRIEAGVTVLAQVEAEPASLLNPRLQSEADARVHASQAAVNQREAELDRARTAADLSEREKQRAAPLHQTGAISAKDWDTADLAASMRQRELRGAEFGLQVAKFELEQAQAALLQAEGHFQQDGAPVKIIAPVTGYVLNVFEESARIIAAGAPIMEVGDPTDLEAEIELLSTDAAAVKPGAEAIIERWGGSEPLRATVEVIEPAAFTKVSALGVEEQRVKVRVEFKEPPSGQAQLGDRYRVEARIVTWSSPDVLQIPSGALFRRGGDWMCFAVSGGRARARKVEIAHENGLAAEVVSGIALGEKVILHAPDAVTDDAPVRPRG